MIAPKYKTTKSLKNRHYHEKRVYQLKLRGCKILIFSKSIKKCIWADEKSKEFIEAIYWMTANRSSMERVAVEKYGKWNTVFKRFNAWSQKNIWDDLHGIFALKTQIWNM